MMTSLYVETLWASTCVASQRLVCPATDDDFVICQIARCGQVLVLPSGHLVYPAIDMTLLHVKMYLEDKYLRFQADV